jgi:1,6-anhydro-N-acetylmuramate kinase
MRVRLTDAEDAAVTQAAEARGMRPSDLAREALLAYIGQPVRQRQLETDTVAMTPVLGRLEALAEKLERTAMSTRIALDMAYASEGERKDVREALTDIAMAVGVLAGSIEPAKAADNF